MLSRRQLLVGAAAVLAGATSCSRMSLKTEPEPAQEGPRPLLRVALLSDPHTEVSGHSVNKLGQALADYKPLRPDLWLFDGDVTNDGEVAQYATFKKLLKGTVKEDQLLVTTGNHDLYDKTATDAEEMQRFRDAFGFPVAYSNRVAGGLHFVMLATEQWKTAPGSGDWAWLSPAQLRWFEQVLGEHRDKFTVVSLHQPLQDTVYWSQGGTGNRFTGCGQIAELNAILKKNAQVKVWLSGHTHMGAEIQGNVVAKNGVTYVGLGSTYYQFAPAEGAEAKFSGFKQNFDASQSRMLELWPDKVLIRTRDHAAKAWMEKYDLTLKRA